MFGKFPLRTRFLIGVGMMLLPLLALAGATVSSFSSLEEAFDDVVEETRAEKDPVVSLQLKIGETLDAAHRYVDYGRPQDQARLVRLVASVDGSLARGEAIPFVQEERILFERAGEAWRLLHPVIEDLSGGGPKASLERFEEGVDRVILALDRINQLADGEIVEEIHKVQRLQARTLITTAVIFLAGMLIALATGLTLARSVVVPAEALEEGARQFAAGNLGHRVTVEGGGELAALTGAFNAMADRLETSQKALKELSIRDPLTGLFNHREIFRVLHEEILRARRYSHPLSFLMLDLDYFKRINDTYGHPVGDRVLKDLAAVIRLQLRQTDLVGRYGGEEFAVALPETTREEAYALARRIHREIGCHRILLDGGEEIGVTVSIGMASFPEDAPSAETLVMAADSVLYQAKESGRDRVCLSGFPQGPA